MSVSVDSLVQPISIALDNWLPARYEVSSFGFEARLLHV